MRTRKKVIGVLGDTHVPERLVRLPARVLTILRNADLIVHTGDFTDRSVLEQLTDLAEVKAVRGNLDDIYLSILLPETERFQIAGTKFGVIHGWGPRAGLEERVLSRVGPVDVLIYGHSHQLSTRWMNGTFLVNPGSCAGNVDGSGSFMLLEVDESIKVTPITL